MAEEYAGLSTTVWAIIGGVLIVFLLILDRWIHCSRNATRLCKCQKKPVDPLEQIPTPEPEVQEEGFRREYDRSFEKNWHVIALPRDKTLDDLETQIHARQEKEARRHVANSKLTVVKGVATVGGIQTE